MKNENSSPTPTAMNAASPTYEGRSRDKSIDNGMWSPWSPISAHSDGEARTWADSSYKQREWRKVAALAAKAEQANSAGDACQGGITKQVLEKFDDLTTYPSPHGTLVRLADVKCRIASPVAERAAAPASVPTEALNALLERIDDAAESYERFGEVCRFEGNSMIYAATLEEIIRLRGEFHVASLTAPEVAQPAAQGEAGCYCGGFDDVHQNGCPEIEAPAPTAGEPSADELMFVGQEFLKWNRSQPTPPVAACKELYIARKVLEIRAEHIKATQGGKERG